MKGSDDGFKHVFRVTSTKEDMALEILTATDDGKFVVLPRLMRGIMHYYLQHNRAEEVWYLLGMMLSTVENYL